MKKTVWINSLKCSIEVNEENRTLIELNGLGHEFENEKINIDNVKNNQRTTQSLIPHGNGIGNEPESDVSVRDKKHSKKHKPNNNT